MKGYDISDDELAKSHGRYMIGGAPRVEHERLFRFGMYCRFQLAFHLCLGKDRPNYFLTRMQNFQNGLER